MKTQYYTATSIDGYIADSPNSLDWLFQFGEGEGTDYPEFIQEVGAIAMGSTTYEWIRLTNRCWSKCGPGATAAADKRSSFCLRATTSGGANLGPF